MSAQVSDLLMDIDQIVHVFFDETGHGRHVDDLELLLEATPGQTQS